MGPQKIKTLGLSAGTLKYVALVCMLIDHLAILVPGPYSLIYLLMRFVGRVAAPLFFFFLAEGYHYTRDKNRYTFRLILFAVVSYVPFVLFLKAARLNTLGFLNMSVAYTLLLSFLALRARHEIHKPGLQALVLCLCVLFSLLGDWSYCAVFAVLLFDYFRGNRRMQQVSFLGLIFSSYVAPLLVAFIRSVAEQQPAWSRLYFVAMWLGVLIPVYLIGAYSGERGHQSRVQFYVFYPVHLLVIVLLSVLMQGLY